MIEIDLTLRDGTGRTVSAKAGPSVIEALRKAGIDELLVLCGGCCSCATCHIHINDENGPFSPMSDNENELLDSSDHKTARSRLSCQLPLSEYQERFSVAVAPED